VDVQTVINMFFFFRTNAIAPEFH